MQYFPHSQPFPRFLFSASPTPPPRQDTETPFVYPSHYSRFPTKSSRYALRGRLLEGDIYFSFLYFTLWN